MKIGNGFISNSSSTSFVLIAKPIDISSITLDMIKDNKITIFGKYLNDGYDIFTLTKDMFNFINENNITINARFFDTIVLIYDEGFIDGKELLKLIKEDERYQLISGEADNHKTTNLRIFLNRYVNEDDL